MKRYVRMARLAYRRRFPKGSECERKLLWGMSLKPGDVIASCTGFNVRVAKIVPEKSKVMRGFFDPVGIRMRRNPSQGWYLTDFLVIDDQGGHHYTASCCWPKETVQQIEGFFSDLETGYDDPVLRQFQQALKDGRRICDDEGIRLPEFGVTELYRPVGEEELTLINATGAKKFPPRLPEQPIFYPVCNVTYAQEIAQRWNAKDGKRGFVTRFLVRTEFLKKFERHIVGARHHEEYWIPAEELEDFNGAILGSIEVLSEHY